MWFPHFKGAGGRWEAEDGRSERQIAASAASSLDTASIASDVSFTSAVSSVRLLQHATTSLGPKQNLRAASAITLAAYDSYQPGHVHLVNCAAVDKASSSHCKSISPLGGQRWGAQPARLGAFCTCLL